jgi:predicted RNA-binding protein with TRAM domain
MEIPDRLRAVFSGNIEAVGGRYVLEIPDREIASQTVSEGGVYRVALLETNGEEPQHGTPAVATDETPINQSDAENAGPPVAEGDILTVEIKDVGSEGDGLTTIGNGYVIIIPGTKIGEEVTIEMTTVRESVGFADVVE